MEDRLVNIGSLGQDVIPVTQEEPENTACTSTEEESCSQHLDTTGIHSEFPATPSDILIKPEPFNMVSECAVDLTIMSDIFKQEPGLTKDVPIDCTDYQASLTDSSSAAIQGKQIWIVGQAGSSNESSPSEPEVQSEDVDNSWQIYKDGEPFGHIVDTNYHGDPEPTDSSLYMNLNSHQSSLPIVSVLNVADQHRTAPNGDNKFQCLTCALSFKRSADLYRHMKTHSGDTLFNCSECPSSLNSPDTLTTQKWSNTGDKPFICSVCDHRCRTRTHLTEHMRIHTGEKPFKCSLCEYRATRQSHLKRHMIIHTGDKPFKCSVCELRCTTRDRLIEHTRTHTGEKPFKCSVCEFRGNTHGCLTIHMRTHTGEKPFRCTVCEYSCISRSRLTAHMNVHTGEKPIKCPECHSRFKRRCYLKKHIIKHHKR